MADLTARACAQCGAQFSPFCEEAKYCSSQCRKESKRASAKKCECASCGTEIVITVVTVPGKSVCRECRLANSGHGTLSMYRRGCRCMDCASTFKVWDRGFKSERELRLIDGELPKYILTRLNAPRVRYSKKELEQRLSMFPACWLCGGDFDGGRHADHVKPLARGGWDCLSNLRAACRSCNSRKNALWPFSAVAERFGLAM